MNVLKYLITIFIINFMLFLYKFIYQRLHKIIKIILNIINIVFIFILLSNLELIKIIILLLSLIIHYTIIVNKKIISLTGIIGSGKSTLLKVITKYANNTYIIDCDRIAHSLYQSDSKYFNLFLNILGKEYLDNNGNLDRDKIGKIFFFDEDFRRKIESLSHKCILKIIIKSLVKSIYFNKKIKYILIDVPLLFETKVFYYISYKIILIYINNNNDVIKRISNRNKNLSIDNIKARINKQLPLEYKLRYSDILIDNSKHYNNEEELLKYLWNSIKHCFSN